MSLIGTRQTSGPRTTISTISARITTLASASRWRLNRRHASRPGENGRARTAAMGTLAVGDARVEPAIEQVRHEVEGDDETGEDEGHCHHHRRVVGQDRGDEERSDSG